MGNGVIEITGKTGKEYTRSGYSQYIERNDGQVYNDKLRAAGNLDEAVRASTDYVNEEIKHPRKDNIKEFARGRVLMRVGQNDYNAEVVVGYTKNGEMLLYDIVNFKPDTFSVKERTSRQPGRGEAGMTGDYGKSSKVEGPIKSGPATTDNSISKNNAAVNSQYTQESENDAADTAENGADTAENAADEGDFAVDRENPDDSAAFSDEALDREGYTPTEQTRVIAMNEATRTGREYGASPAQQAAAEELSHILDRRIIFFRSDDPTVNGYYKNGTIHVNAASGRTVASIIASEMTHAIETTSDYSALRELALRELSREKGMSLDELRAQKKETYAAHGENLDADGVDFELCEEYVGRYLFGDVAQIRAAVEHKPSLGRKIIAFLDEIIRRLTGRVRAVSSRILKDAQYARELWGRAVREAKARGASGRSEYTAEQRKNTRPDIDRSDVVFANDGVSYALAPNAEANVDRALSDKDYTEDVYLTENSPAVIASQKGARNLPMRMKASHIRENIYTEAEAKRLRLKVNKYINYHGLGKELFLKIIGGLDDVTLAYRGTKNASDPARHENYFLLISQYKDANGNTVNIPVYINEKGQHNEVFIDTNKIATVFGRDDMNRYIDRELRAGNLVRIKNRNTQASELTSPINASYNENASADITISQNDQFVNSSISENEKNDTRYSIEDSGWDAYHRRNQEELESNTAAAERARREERAEERAAAEEEARDRLDTLAGGGAPEDVLYDSAQTERGNIERENVRPREATMTQEEYESIIGKPLTEEEAADLREEISKAAGSIAAEEGLYSAAEEERLFLEEERTTVAPKWFEQVKKSGEKRQALHT